MALKMENYEKFFIRYNIHPNMSQTARFEIYGRKCFLLDLEDDNIWDEYQNAAKIYQAIVDICCDDTILTREQINEKLERRGWGTLDEDEYEEGINQLIDWGFLVEDKEHTYYDGIPTMWFTW